MTQGIHISAGVQDEYDVGQTAESAVLGAVIGSVASGGGKLLNDKINQQPKINQESVNGTKPDAEAVDKNR